MLPHVHCRLVAERLQVLNAVSSPKQKGGGGGGGGGGGDQDMIMAGAIDSGISSPMLLI